MKEGKGRTEWEKAQTYRYTDTYIYKHIEVHCAGVCMQMSRWSHIGMQCVVAVSCSVLQCGAP